MLAITLVLAIQCFEFQSINEVVFRNTIVVSICFSDWWFNIGV